MGNAEINSILFRGIISNLNELYSENGNRLGSEGGEENYSFSLAFQPRPTENFTHNYEREKFLHNRDKFIVIRYNNSNLIAVKCYRRDYITIYRRPFELVFGKDSHRVLTILEKLLNKFYEDVKFEEVSHLNELDASPGRSSNRMRVVNEI